MTTNQNGESRSKSGGSAQTTANPAEKTRDHALTVATVVPADLAVTAAFSARKPVNRVDLAGERPISFVVIAAS